MNMTRFEKSFGAAGLTLAALLLIGCSQEIQTDLESEGVANPTSLASGLAERERDSGYRTHLYSERDVDVFGRLGSSEQFEQGAIVQKVHVEVGDRVKAGQLLATLEDDEVRLELEAAQARADEAASQYQRTQELRQRELVAPSAYDNALYVKRNADAELERARLDVTRTRIVAPFAGVVSRRYIREGELIEGNSPLFRVTAMAPLRARLLVPESQIGEFNTGAPVRVKGLGGESATARVLVVGPTVDPGSGTREVILELSDLNGFRPGAAVIAEPSTSVAAGEE
jgi:RND family efflux transporter MFP subunit